MDATRRWCRTHHAVCAVRTNKQMNCGGKLNRTHFKNCLSSLWFTVVHAQQFGIHHDLGGPDYGINPLLAMMIPRVIRSRLSS